MNKNVIKIKGDEFVLKYTLRSMFVFEGIAGKAFELTSLMDEYLFFYSVLLANNPDDFKIEYDEFIDDICDNDPLLFEQFKEWLISEIKIKNQMLNSTSSEDKKKATRKNKS